MFIMESVYVIIAENGEHGLWSVTSYSSMVKAEENLSGVAEKIAKELGVGEYSGKEPWTELYKRSGLITNGDSNISIEIHETVVN
jgi:hypothetical protein